MEELARSLYVGALVLSAVITASIGVSAFRQWDARSAKSVAALMAVITWWTVCYAVAVEIDTVFVSAVFRIMYLGVIFVPPAFLIFTVQFAGLGRWVTPRTLALLAIEPVTVTAMIWIDPQQGPLAGVFNARIARSFDLHSSGGIVLGRGFDYHSVYAFLLVAVGYLLLAWGVWRAPAYYRKQAVILFVGSFAVIAANILSITYLLPHYRIDVTWFGFLLWGLVMVHSLRGQNLLDLLPVARHEIVEAMPDGFVVIDSHDRAVDINPAAKRMLRIDTTIKPGASVSDFFPEWRALRSSQTQETAYSREIQFGAGQALYAAKDAGRNRVFGAIVATSRADPYPVVHADAVTSSA